MSAVKARGFRGQKPDLFWTKDSSYGVRYQCTECGKITLGDYGHDNERMHYSTCPRRKPSPSPTAERKTAGQIDGLDHWLANVDPRDPVEVPKIMIDAMQSIIEELREWRAGALDADKVKALQHVARYMSETADAKSVGHQCTASCRVGGGIGVLNGILAAHGVKP